MLYVCVCVRTHELKDEHNGRERRRKVRSVPPYIFYNIIVRVTKESAANAVGGDDLRARARSTGRRSRKKARSKRFGSAAAYCTYTSLLLLVCHGGRGPTNAGICTTNATGNQEPTSVSISGTISVFLVYDACTVLTIKKIFLGGIVSEFSSTRAYRGDSRIVVRGL